MGPPEIQAHIAALLAGEVGARRGPRQKPFDQEMFEDEYLIRRVEQARQRLKSEGARAPQERAFAQVAPEFGWQDGDTARTMYRRAKRRHSLDVANTDAEIEQILRENGWAPFKGNNK
jgi:hypothetical protein